MKTKSSQETGGGNAPRVINYDSESGSFFYNIDHQNTDGTWGMHSVGLSPSELNRELNRLTTQRDELLAAAKDAKTALLMILPAKRGEQKMKLQWEAANALSAAIAKVEDAQ